MLHDANSGLNYTWDQENRLTGAAGYTYSYDADSNRVRKSNGNLAANGTLYWYMTPGVVAETDLAGTLKSEYVFFDGERVARKDFPGNTVAYYFSDHLKTASVITDSAGVIKAESDYYPWGGELQFVNNDSNDYKFTGKKRDVETGLDYFGARYYSNGLGRWVSADWSTVPIPVPYADFGDPQSLNLYGYVGGNPASRADVDGHCLPCLAHAAEEFAESPAGEELIRDGGKIAGAIGAGIAIGWAHTSGFAKEAWGYFKDAAAQGGGSGLADLPQPPGGVVKNLIDSHASKDAPANTDKPGTLGKPDHQGTVEEERQRVDGKKEVTMPTPDGSKGSRRADAVGTNPETGAPEIVQVYRPTKGGNVPKREVDAANDIQKATGIKPTMVPVRPLPEKKEPQ
jgi:RHS repeat-associated protein